MASMISKWLGWFGRDSGIGTADGTQNPVPGASLVSDVQTIGIDSALQLSAVWSCVDRRATAIASLPFFAYVKKPDGTKDLARDSMLYQLLHEAPNQRMTPYDFWRTMLLNHDLRGNAYARLERNRQGEVIAMWPLPADQVEMQIDGGVVTYFYKVGSDVAVFAEKNILHLRNLGNGSVGLNKLDYMRVTTDEMAKSQGSASKLFGSSGKPTGVLMVDKVLTNDQRDKIKQNFAGMADGSQSRLYLLEANMQYKQLSLSPEDQQLLETRQFSVEEICRWYDVPPVLVHHSNVTTWGSGIEQIMDGFYKLTIRPMLVAIEQAVRRKVLTPLQRQNMVCEFALDALLRGSPAQRADIYSKHVQNGIMTRNECRQLENLPPMPDANDLTAQTNLVPLGKLGKEVEAAPKAMEDAKNSIRRLQIDNETLSKEVKMLQNAPKEPTPQPVINNYVSLPETKNDVHVYQAETKNVTNINNTIEPTPVHIEQAEVNVSVEAIMPAQEAPNVDVKVEAVMPDTFKTEITGMPDRVTASSVQRDNDGNIVKTTQTERDA